MKIKLTKVYVNDQERALRFYTEKLGFAPAADVSQGGYRWLTVTSPRDESGVELQLALNEAAAAKTFQEAQFQQGEPAAMFHVSDLQSECERLASAGVEFTVPFTQEQWGSMAVLNDTCGNLIQLTQPAW